MARTPTVTRDQVPEKYRDAFDHEVAISRHAMENGPGSVIVSGSTIVFLLDRRTD